jgi:hypothetical protein
MKLSDAERDKQIEAIYTDFRAQPIDSYKTVRGIPGVEDAVRAIEKMGLSLATSTGFDGPITSSVMARLGWENYFVARVTSDDDVVHGRTSPYMLFHPMEAAQVDNVLRLSLWAILRSIFRPGRTAECAASGCAFRGRNAEDHMEREPHSDLIDSVDVLPALLRSKFAVS